MLDFAWTFPLFVPTYNEVLTNLQWISLIKNHNDILLKFTFQQFDKSSSKNLSNFQLSFFCGSIVQLVFCKNFC